MSAVRRNDGFSLIELVVCLVVLGVLAAFAGPRFIDRQPFNEKGYTSELVAALRAARNTAIANNCDVQVTIGPATGYQALLRAPVGNLCAPAGAFTTAIRLSSGQLLANTPPAGVAADPQVVFVFAADGRVAAPPPPYNVGAFTVRVSASGYVQ